MKSFGGFRGREVDRSMPIEGVNPFHVGSRIKGRPLHRTLRQGKKRREKEGFTHLGEYSTQTDFESIKCMQLPLLDTMGQQSEEPLEVGNSPRIAQQSYLLVTEDDFASAARAN